MCMSFSNVLEHAFVSWVDRRISICIVRFRRLVLLVETYLGSDEPSMRRSMARPRTDGRAWHDLPVWI